MRDDVPTPDDDEFDQTPGRYSELYPRHFWLYFDRWIKFWPKYGVHVKRAYDGGFVQKKVRKTGLPLYLFPDLAIEWAERHLHPSDWADWKQYEVDSEQDHGPFWLGLYAPKKCSADNIDYDAKRHLLDYYRSGKGSPWLPLVVPDLDHFRTLKRLHDNFPGRIWCISSATLGIHIWRKHEWPVATETSHAEVKRDLDAIGLGHVEVHPMKGRCLRRPFGTDYKTITPQGVITDWREQVEYFEFDGRTAPFEEVFKAVVNEVSSQLAYYKSAGEVRDRRGLSKRLVVADQRWAEIAAWRRAGYPDIQHDGGRHAHMAIPESIENAPSLQPPGSGPAAERRRGDEVVQDHPALLASLRDGNWAVGLLDLAHNGLTEEDSLPLVAYEMAKWLWWIELFPLYQDERRCEIERLLIRFALAKHNGKITRLTTGREEDVLRQIGAIVRAAGVLNQEDRARSLEYFALLRQQRDGGLLLPLINIAPALDEEDQLAPPSLSLRSGNYVWLGEPSDEPLPESVESRLMEVIASNKMRRRDGEYPFFKLSRRLLNACWRGKGAAALSEGTLKRFMGKEGKKDRTQLLHYKDHLTEAGLIRKGWKDSSRWGEANARYSLTPRTKRAFQEHCCRKSTQSVG